MTLEFEIPRGFRFSGVACGIKASGRPDYALIAADRPCVAAGVYTQNLVFAAPVELDRERTPSSRIQAVAVNSGNANACTGDRGLDDARTMAAQAAEACGLAGDQVLVMSTGIIGEFLPMECLARGAREAAASLGGSAGDFHRAAAAFLTTDQGPKVGHRALQLGERTIRLVGIAKGAGMIGPRMATMLATICTDATLRVEDAQRLLGLAVEDSFNCISVEGHMSTNDTVLLLASGAAEGSAEPLAADELEQFADALRALCTDLARMIPADGEGATHLITIEVSGAPSREAARQVAQTVAQSALVKTAIHGGDPNWGRIVSAAGYAGVPFDARRLALTLNGTPLYADGRPLPFDAAAVSQSIRGQFETTIQLELGAGDGAVRYWTSDLTVDYVKFNADYHT